MPVGINTVTVIIIPKILVNIVGIENPEDPTVSLMGLNKDLGFGYTGFAIFRALNVQRKIVQL